MNLATDSTFNVTSPNFPKPYPRTVDCYWIVTTSTKRAIILNFLIFDVALNRDDFVIALSNITIPPTSLNFDDSEDEPFLEKFTGSLAPRSMMIPHSEIQLLWNANVWNTKQQVGFVVEISSAQLNSKYTFSWKRYILLPKHLGLT